MQLYRLLLPLFFAFALLSAQQGGATHALGHAFEQTRQQDKQAPHSPGCDKCASYAQLGNALNSTAQHFALPRATGDAIARATVTFRSIHTLPAVARGPPALLAFA